MATIERQWIEAMSRDKDSVIRELVMEIVGRGNTASAMYMREIADHIAYDAYDAGYNAAIEAAAQKASTLVPEDLSGVRSRIAAAIRSLKAGTRIPSASERDRKEG